MTANLTRNELSMRLAALTARFDNEPMILCAGNGKRVRIGYDRSQARYFIMLAPTRYLYADDIQSVVDFAFLIGLAESTETPS